MVASTQFIYYVDSVEAATSALAGSSACLDTYKGAVSTADAILRAKIATCNGSRECERQAVDDHIAAIKAARDAYFACVSSSPTGQVETHYQTDRSAMVAYHDYYDDYVPPEE